MTIIHNMPRLLLAFAIRSTTRRQETPIWLEATFQVFYNKVSWFTYSRLPSSFAVLATAPFIRPFHVPLKNILILANFDKCPFMPGAEAEKVLLLISRRISSHQQGECEKFPRITLCLLQRLFYAGENIHQAAIKASVDKLKLTTHTTPRPLRWSWWCPGGSLVLFSLTKLLSGKKSSTLCLVISECYGTLC